MKKRLLLVLLLVTTACACAAQTHSVRTKHGRRRIPVAQPLPDPMVLPHTTDQNPMFPGNLQQWLHRNLQYPEPALHAGRSGTAVVVFVVQLDGSISDAKVLRSAGDASLDEEALRLVRQMPAWIPASKGGRPVRSIFKIKVNFRLA